MTRASGLLLVLYALCGCGGQPQPARTLPDPSQPPRQGFREASDALSAAMRQLAEQLAQAGFVPEHSEMRGFLTAGARDTHPLHVPDHSCVTLVALATPGIHDMDAAVYGPDGDPLAADSQPDAHPTLQVCSEHARDLYYILQVYEGAGSYLVVPFYGTARNLDEVTDVLGVQPQVARLGEGGKSSVDRVAALRDGLLRRGFEAHDAALGVPLSRDQRLRVSLSVEPGSCYTAAGFALEGIENLDLRVLDDEGVEVARDESPEADAAAQFCVSRRAEFTAELHAAQGEGRALWTVFRADAASVGDSSALWLGERPTVRPSTASLPAARATVAGEAARDGFRIVRLLHDGYLTTGEVVRVDAEIGPRRCARVHAVGGHGIRLLELEVRNTEGELLSRSEGGAATTYVHVCADKPEGFDFTVHARGGGGQVALVSHERRLAAVAPAAGDERVRAHFLQAVRRARDAGYLPHGAFARGPQHVKLGKAAPRSVILGIEAARCVRAYALSEAGEVKTQLLVGDEVVASERSPAPALFCAPADSPLELMSVALDTQADDAWLMVLIK